MIKSGKFISNFIKTEEDAVQPNGVDLSIDKIYSLEGNGILTDDEYKKPYRTEVEPESVETDLDNLDEAYILKPDYYVIEYSETIKIPENHVGLVFPRSRLMRSGGTLYTALWDSGYEGKGEGGLENSKTLYIEPGMKIGQMVYFTTEELDEHYNGTHQGENL